MIEGLKDILRDAEPLRMLQDRLTGAGPARPVRVAGTAGSLLPLLGAVLREQLEVPLLVVARDRETAERMRDDLSLALPAGALAYFAGEHSHGADPGSDAADVQALRAAATGAAAVVLTHPQALTLTLPSPEIVRASALVVDTGSTWAMSDLRRRLDELGFTLKDFVAVHGDYAVRGGILDVFPFTSETPVRMEFFGDTVESLRQFDALSQRSIKELSSAVIVPDVYQAGLADEAAPSGLAAYLGPGTLVLLDEPDLIRATLEHPAPGVASPAPPDVILAQLAPWPAVHAVALGTPADGIDLGGAHQAAFNGSIRLFHEHLAGLTAQGYRVIITCDGHGELTRLKDLLSSVNTEIEEQEAADRPVLDLGLLEFSLDALHAGFIFPALCSPSTPSTRSSTA